MPPLDTSSIVQMRIDERRPNLLTGDAAPLQVERSQLTLDRHSCTLGGRRRGPYGSRSAPQLLCSCACEQRDHDVGVHGRVFLRGGEQIRGLR